VLEEPLQRSCVGRRDHHYLTCRSRGTPILGIPQLEGYTAEKRARGEAVAQSTSIMALLNKIHNDHSLVLPDIQRDFVWDRDQIRLLMDSLMKGYPFGSLLIWQTRYLEVAYREFVADYTPGQAFVPKVKGKNKPLEMVLDGQQRVQSFYIAIYGSHEGRRLYFDVTSGPVVTSTDDEDDGESGTYRFVFRRDQEPSRPKQHVLVSEIMSWGPRFAEQQISRLIDEIPLRGSSPLNRGKVWLQ
jgi:hypothetical protein